MSAHEVLTRASALAGRFREEQEHRLGLNRNPVPFAASHPPPAFRYPFLSSDELAGVASALREDAAYTARVRANADALLRGEFDFFGRRFRFDPDNIPWTADPVSGRPWPLRFHTAVDIFSGDVGHGDVKFVWELNRHQFLVTLGKAWRLTGDPRYAETALAWLDSWHAANPYRMGINWTSALEHAVRSLAWLTTAGLIDDAPAFTPARRHAMATALHQHGLYLASHLSFYFSPYNHLIGEATALHAIGALAPDLPRARTWRARGWAILCDEIERQFHPDGGTVEQAFGYHHFTLGFYLQAWLIARAVGDDVPPRFVERITAAWRFADAVTRPDGRTPMVGDADEGKALDLEQPHPWDFSAYRVAGQVLTGTPLHAPVGRAPDAAWLVGTQALETPAPAGAPPASVVLPDSGYVVERDVARGHWLLFDTGDIAHGVPEDDEVSAAHGHADLLSFELAVGGRPRLVDPGFFTYNGPVPWHRYFRDTHAHNALVVDDLSQATYRGRLKWSHGARAELRAALSSEVASLVEGRHDAFRTAAGRVVHERTIAWLRPDVWIVRDVVHGPGAHVIDRYWHFDDERVSLAGTRALTAAPDGANVELWVAEPDAEARLAAGGPEPADGWVAERYEVKRPAAVVRHRLTRQGTATLYSVIAVTGRCQFDAATSVLDGTVTGLDLPLADGGAVVARWSPDPAAMTVGALHAVACALVATVGPHGDVATVAIRGATRVEWQGAVVTDGARHLTGTVGQHGMRWRPWEGVSH